MGGPDPYPWYIQKQVESKLIGVLWISKFTQSKSYHQVGKLENNREQFANSSASFCFFLVL